MTPDQARAIQEELNTVKQNYMDCIKKRDEAFLQLSRTGMTPRQIAKEVRINYSVVYRILDRAGYTPKFSFTEGRLRNLTQEAIVKDLKAKMATHAKQKP